MKCQILFSGKNKKNNIILSSAENAQRVVKVKFQALKAKNLKHAITDLSLLAGIVLTDRNNQVLICLSKHTAAFGLQGHLAVSDILV